MTIKRRDANSPAKRESRDPTAGVIATGIPQHGDGHDRLENRVRGRSRFFDRTDHRSKLQEVGEARYGLHGNVPFPTGGIARPR